MDEPVVPISPQDIKYWEIVQRVRGAFSRGRNTTSEACREAGVARSTYYIALKSPYVQQKMAEQMDALAQASLEILERNWLRTLMNMASIATSEDSKECPGRVISSIPAATIFSLSRQSPKGVIDSD